jgi:hypothetical protein
MAHTRHEGFFHDGPSVFVYPDRDAMSAEEAEQAMEVINADIAERIATEYEDKLAREQSIEEIYGK